MPAPKKPTTAHAKVEAAHAKAEEKPKVEEKPKPKAKVEVEPQAKDLPSGELEAIDILIAHHEADIDALKDRLK